MDADAGRLVKHIVGLGREIVCHGILRVSGVRGGSGSLGEWHSSDEAEGC